MGKGTGGGSVMKVESQTKQTQERVLSPLNIIPALSQGQRQTSAPRVMCAAACSLLQYLKKILTPHLHQPRREPRKMRYSFGNRSSRDALLFWACLFY